MKQKEIVKIVEARFKTIDKLCHKILKKFNTADIHDFRVEIKKLRAFLKLCDNKKVKKPGIPTLLKSFYGCTGLIRDIQLYKLSLLKYTTDKNIKQPAEYTTLLKNEKDHFTKQASSLMKNYAVQDVKQKLFSQLPEEIKKSTLKKFTENKLRNLKHQLENLKDDTAVHNVRKILKDLLYNRDYIKDHANFPKAISNKNKLRSLTKTLGEFIDKSMQLEFLQEHYLGKLKDANEKKLLLKIKKERLHEKEIIMHQQIHNYLKELKEQL